MLIEDLAIVLGIDQINSTVFRKEMFEKGEWESSSINPEAYKLCKNAIIALSELPYYSMFSIGCDPERRIIYSPHGGYFCRFFLNEEDFYDEKGRVVFNRDKCIAEIPEGGERGSFHLLNWLGQSVEDFPIEEFDRLTVAFWFNFFYESVQTYLQDKIKDCNEIITGASIEKTRYLNILNATQQVLVEESIG